MGDLKFEALVNTLLHSLAVVQAKKPGYTMRNMETEALVDRIVEVKTEKVGQTQRSEGRVTSRNAGPHAGGNGGRVSWQNVEAQAVVITLFATLPQVVGKRIVLCGAWRTRRNVS